MKNKRIENNFTYHAPKEHQVKRYQELRDKAKELAYLIEEYCPESREKSLAMTKLEESIAWANAAIARNPFGKYPKVREDIICNCCGHSDFSFGYVCPVCEKFICEFCYINFHEKCHICWEDKKGD